MSASNEEPVIYAVRSKELAVRDINAAYVRLAEITSPDKADAWQDGLREAFASLATLPSRCPLAPEKFQREVRYLLYRRSPNSAAYRILFYISGEAAASPDAPTVNIIHVRHAAMKPLTPKQARQIESLE